MNKFASEFEKTIFAELRKCRQSQKLMDAKKEICYDCLLIARKLGIE
jgi:hypothetical protein